VYRAGERGRVAALQAAARRDIHLMQSAKDATMFHKTKYMLGFHVEATDGGIGHVDDFLVDQTWNVRYLVVDTSNWIGGDSVLVPSVAVDRVDPPDRKIYVKLTRVEVAACPLEDTADIPVIETLGPTIL